MRDPRLAHAQGGAETNRRNRGDGVTPMDQQSPRTEQTDGAATAPESGDTGALKQAVIEMLATVTDPEIPVNIYELGLIYEVEINADGDARVVMTLTTPNCPVAESMPGEVEDRVGSVPGIRSVSVELVWDPPWTPDRMSEAAKLELGFI
ncbi:MAG: SUF system Fe-S cluster assembly protein [Alphaproteobacteria bacterium]|nr:MAG: SUF system Fe-S cluster assembly protein [Alphaproteobacteria bacterium]